MVSYFWHEGKYNPDKIVTPKPWDFINLANANLTHAHFLYKKSLIDILNLNDLLKYQQKVLLKQQQAVNSEPIFAKVLSIVPATSQRQRKCQKSEQIVQTQQKIASLSEQLEQSKLVAEQNNLLSVLRQKSSDLPVNLQQLKALVLGYTVLFSEYVVEFEGKSPFSNYATYGGQKTQAVDFTSLVAPDPTEFINRLASYAPEPTPYALDAVCAMLEAVMFEIPEDPQEPTPKGFLTASDMFENLQLTYSVGLWYSRE